MIVNQNISYDEPFKVMALQKIFKYGKCLFGLHYSSCPAMKKLETESKKEANQGFKSLFGKIPFELGKIV